MEMTKERWLSAAWRFGEYLNERTGDIIRKRYSVRHYMAYTDGAELFELVLNKTMGYDIVVSGPYASTEALTAKGFMERCAEKFEFSLNEVLMKMMLSGLLK